MKKTTLFLVLTICSISSLFSQNRKIILESELKNPYPFNTVTEVIDRTSSEISDYGFVQTGAFNRMTPVSFISSLKNDIQTFLNSTNQIQNKHDSTVIILVNYFRLAEKTGNLSEVGLFNYSADYFLKKNSTYQLMLSIDTVFENYGLDVTKKLIKSIGDSLLSIQYKILDTSFKGTNRYFSFNQILKFDSINKSAIPVYQVDSFKRGVYLTWQDFKKNQPNFDSTFLYYSNSHKMYFSKSNNKEGGKIDAKSTFAICSQNAFYFSDGSRFYKADYKNGDFYIKAPGNKNVDASSVFVASMMFGIVGGAIASAAATTYDELLYKLNYKNGKFIPLKIIPAPFDDEFDENGKYKTK
jgi:hypothetical protein